MYSRDGDVGVVKEFYFDDHHWTIRYLVADTGNWLTGKTVLISPHALIGVDKEDRQINIDLTKKQIEESPALGSDEPVSRQFEGAYLGYYGWPTYWGSADMWGTSPYIRRDRENWQKSIQNQNTQDPHLRSTKAVSGYHIHAVDGEIGHVEDFIIDDETWEILYLIIDTQNWWFGKKVLISTRWIERVSWDESMVFVNLTCESIEQSPEYNPTSLPTRDYEARLHQHYNRQGYWSDERLPRGSCGEESSRRGQL